MNKISLPKRAKALVIVAHPDDETIWMGGMIARKKNWHWTILSLCRGSDMDRAPKFRQVCSRYRARALMADLEDGGKLSISESVILIEKILKTKLGRQKFDYIFTHNQNGEYGHPRHKGAYEGVKKMLKLGYFKPKAVFYFNYRKKSRKKYSPLTLKVDSDLILKLTPAEYRKKRKIMSEIYGFTPDGIDTNYCTNPEAFKILKIK